MLSVPNFDDDFINSKDVMAHTAYLRERVAEIDASEYELPAEREEAAEELAAWERLREAFGDDRRWEAGVTFIQDMSKYMDECVEDQFGSDGRVSWPLTCVDWDRALDELGQDCQDVTITDDWGAEHTYFVR